MQNTEIITTESTAITAPLEMIAQLTEMLKAFGQALTLRERAGEIASNTAAAYLRGAGKFIAWLSVQESCSVEADTIRSWKAELSEKGYTPATVNAWLAGVKALFAWAAERGRLPYNPAALVKGASRKGAKRTHKREALTALEVRRSLALPNTGTQGGARDLAIIALMAYTGVRSVEVHRADLSDLRTQGGRLVLFVQGKGHTESDDFVVIANPALESALRDWLVVRGQHPGALFCSLSNRSHGERLSLRALRHLVKANFAQAGVIGNKSTHSLRHTAITAAITAAAKKGLPITSVMSMSRHANVDTLMIYAHELDRLESPIEALINY